jgi:hypothetical protein
MNVPWIHEPSVNNKLKRREGSASGSTEDSLIKPRQSQNRISGFSGLIK